MKLLGFVFLCFYSISILAFRLDPFLPGKISYSFIAMIEKSSQQQRREKNPFANLGKKVHERKENPHPLDPNANRPFVHRSLRWPERVPLTQIVPGQKFRGLIISVRG